MLLLLLPLYLSEFKEPFFTTVLLTLPTSLLLMILHQVLLTRNKIALLLLVMISHAHLRPPLLPIMVVLVLNAPGPMEIQLVSSDVPMPILPVSHKVNPPREPTQFTTVTNDSSMPPLIPQLQLLNIFSGEFLPTPNATLSSVLTILVILG